MTKSLITAAMLLIAAPAHAHTLQATCQSVYDAAHAVMTVRQSGRMSMEDMFMNAPNMMALDMVTQAWAIPQEDRDYRNLAAIMFGDEARARCIEKGGDY